MWVNLHRWLPRDVRKLIYAKLTKHERAVVEIAHGIRVQRRLPFTFAVYAKRFPSLLEWSRLQGCEWGATTVNMAALADKTDMLKSLNNGLLRLATCEDDKLVLDEEDVIGYGRHFLLADLVTRGFAYRWMGSHFIVVVLRENTRMLDLMCGGK